MSIETVRVVHVPAEYAGIMDNVILEGGPSYYAPIKASRSYAKRVVACWNACAGIPTETLETGRVVVVPEGEARLAADAVAIYLSMGFQVTQAEIEQMERFLSRFQQNGGEQQ